MAIDNLDKLEVWYRLQDFKDGTFTEIIKDSSNKNRNGSFVSTPELKKTNNNRNSNSYKLLRNNFKAMKSTNKGFNISTPNIGSLSEFTIMVKVLYENSVGSELTLVTYNNLVVKITGNVLNVYDGSDTSKSYNHTFSDNWTAVILTFSNGVLSVSIDNILKERYAFTFSGSDNQVKLLNNSGLAGDEINVSVEDLRVYSSKVKYETLYSYVNGLNIV